MKLSRKTVLYGNCNTNFLLIWEGTLPIYLLHLAFIIFKRELSTNKVQKDFAQNLSQKYNSVFTEFAWWFLE